METNQLKAVHSRKQNCGVDFFGTFLGSTHAIASVRSLRL